MLYDFHLAICRMEIIVTCVNWASPLIHRYFFHYIHTAVLHDLWLVEFWNVDFLTVRKVDAPKP